MNAIKLTTLTTGIAAIGWGAYFFNLKKSASKMVVENNIGVDASLQGLILTIRPLIKNPTRFIFEIEHPFVNLLLKDDKGKLNTIGSSTPKNNRYTIPANGQINLEEIRITINWRNVPSLLQQAKTGKINLVSETLISVFLNKLFNLRLSISQKENHEINTSKIISWL